MENLVVRSPRHTVDVTVVIPSYKRIGTLMEALASIFCQAVQPREVIVVEGGESDEVAAYLDTLKPSVRSLRTPISGVQAGRNVGIMAATSTWVSLIDDDDLYRSSYFETVQPIIEDGRADLIGVDHVKFFGSISRPYMKSNFQRAPDGYWDGFARPAMDEAWTYVGQFPAERLLRFIGFYPSGMLIRKDLFERLGGYDSGVVGLGPEDIEFLSRALPMAKLAIVWPPLVDQRVHAGIAGNSGNPTGGDAFPRLGRWRVFEYIHAKNRHGSPELERALEVDLPARRISAFTTAFELGLLSDMRRAASLMRISDWTPKLLLKRFLPHALAKRLTKSKAENRFRTPEEEAGLH